MKKEEHRQGRFALLPSLLLGWIALFFVAAVGIASAETMSGFAPAQIPAETSGDEIPAENPDDGEPPSYPEINWEIVDEALDDCVPQEMWPESDDGWQETYYCRPLTKQERRDYGFDKPDTLQKKHFIDRDFPNFDRELCTQLGGELRTVEGAPPGGGVCSDIDTDDTFCIAGAPEAFPCRGLYKQVLLCNYYNHKGKDPFLCAAGEEAKCPGETACGNKCVSGGRFAAPERIPYVAGDYTGEVFQATGMDLQVATVALSHPNLTAGRLAGGTLAVSVAQPFAAWARVTATVGAQFSCAGLDAYFSAEESLVFTITALSSLEDEYFFEHESPQYKNGEPLSPFSRFYRIPTLTIMQVPGSGRDLDIDEGKVKIVGDDIPIGATLTAVAHGTAAELLGTVTIMITAIVRGSFHPLFRPRCRYSGIRHENTALAETLNRREEYAACSILSMGADVNSEHDELRYPLDVAVGLDWINAAEVLLSHDASVDNRSRRDQFTALHHSRSVAMVSLLLKNGADENVAGAANIRPMDTMAILYELEEGEKDLALLAAIRYLWDEGGRCGDPNSEFVGHICSNPHNVSLSADSPQAVGASGALGASCDQPETINIGGSTVYFASCRLECDAGRESGEWRCYGLQEGSETLQRMRENCEARTMSESGLSCAAE